MLLSRGRVVEDQRRGQPQCSASGSPDTELCHQVGPNQTITVGSNGVDIPTRGHRGRCAACCREHEPRLAYHPPGAINPAR